ncbi:MAG: carbamoyltransferase HypF [Bacteroidetes bacterium]|nr:carbamoyltransferase HypF [Bacteroidota bacterium]
MNKLKRLSENFRDITANIRVKGLVQGVGFRPFIYRLAYRYNLTGWVENRNDGVVIKAIGQENKIDEFIGSIKREAPVASNISSVSKEIKEHEEFNEFRIIKSKNASKEITDISPDIAVCDACLKDMKAQPHRIDYPFINCTNCDPRFSIIKDLPYDREKTTMAPFIMCDTCQKEYEDVLDRRFHAQPVACNYCGPIYKLHLKSKTINHLNEIILTVKDLLHDGKIIAVKGIGGFQIACDAQNQAAVKRLRDLKNREGKPFAVMFKNVEALKEFVFLNEAEQRSITSWRRPILILKEKQKLASDVSVGFNTIGTMLPYMPFHYLLFEQLNIPAIVLTSGNISEEPIVIDNDEALKTLTRIADAVLTYNRDIYNRTDDSVAFIINNRERVIRRSRSYSPEPVNLNLNVDGIFAAGAELVNSFCLGKGNQAILSQHIGDLKNLETLEFYTESYKRFKKLFRAKPELVVHDMHPDYLSTNFAKDLKLETIEVQHHHAHIASCMAEYGLDEKVIGVSFDGTGLGDDGNIWGGEFFICDLADYKRLTHFDYMPLPGGDQTTKEPWRTGISYLYKIFGREFLNLNTPFLKELDHDKVEFIVQAIEKNINCPLSSSAGRLFDAVAAITNICPVSKFHAEAPMRLEAAIKSNESYAYPFDFGETISFETTIREIVEDLKEGFPVSGISAKFHNTVINVIFAVASLARKETGINKVVLSGGTFQNRYILSNIESKLILEGFEVFTQTKVPSNDGGIALGQLVIGAKRREKTKD